MNYRHSYHAGNFADVFKHAILARILTHLLVKDTPFRYMDSHSGIGLYDLTKDEAAKTNEADLGIRRFLNAPRGPALDQLFEPYLNALKAHNGMEGKHYPGSPMIAANILRETDRLALAELHPEDARELRQRLDYDARVKVFEMDGYAAMNAWLPPPERRGLVLVDPPYEERGELERVVEIAAAALTKWPTGIFAFWYPVKAHREADLFAADIASLGIPKTLRLEVLVDAGGDARKLNGSGMIIFNPPWKLREEASVMLPFLAKTLATGAHTSWKADWLVGERN
jgi:23S rRNA (adenine2030-N6)-methyltransferase